MESQWQRLYRRDSTALGEIGGVLVRAELPRVQVRLPRSLAEQAVAAWERQDDDGPGEPETYEQRVQRHRAGTLALIGLSIKERGRVEGDEVTVDLSPNLIGVAIDASDDLSAT